MNKIIKKSTYKFITEPNIFIFITRILSHFVLLFKDFY